MTADQFRGFLANFLINITIVSALWIAQIDFPLWAYAVIGIGLFIVAPIYGYHPPAPEKKEKAKA